RGLPGDGTGIGADRPAPRPGGALLVGALRGGARGDVPGAGLSATITVVTICRNALSLLRPTVESVLEQRTPAVEYWIVDGGSTDGTREYLASIPTDGVRWVSEPDRGIADAMNKG